MPSSFAAGGCIALKSNLNGKYLRYSPEKGKILEVSGEDVISPFTRFYAELSKKNDGHVHIRCCYNNKYWVAREVNHEWCLMGDANEPEEDLSDPSCTLLRHEPSSIDVNSVNLQHAMLKRRVYMLADAHPTEKTLIAGSLLLGNKDTPDEDAYMFSVIDLEGHMVLPKHVCFKGDNGFYLKPYVQHFDYLRFMLDDIADPLVRNIIYNHKDGTISIYSNHSGLYWKLGDDANWITARGSSSSSDITPRHNKSTLFRALWLGDGNKCALKGPSHHYCKRDMGASKCGLITDCLKASASTLTREAQLELHETVLSRRIYGVIYNFDHVNIHNLKPRTYCEKKVVNKTSVPQKSTVTISYSVMTETRWDSSVSLKLGVKTTIKAGVPLIAEASVEMSAEFSGSYTWGETKSETENHSNEEEVVVPAHTEVTVRVVATQGICDIPFSYQQEDILTTGEKVHTVMGDGIYRGINSFGFTTVMTEKKI